MSGKPLPYVLPSRRGFVFLVLSAAALFGLVSCANSPASTPTTQPIVQQPAQPASGVSYSHTVAPTPTAYPPAVIEQADAAQKVLINIYQRVDPSVVNIEINSDQSEELDSSGSGFVLDADGHILTNSHVVQGAKDIFVTFYDGYTTTAKIVGADDYSDLAAIKVEVAKERLMPVTLGDSANLQVGQRVVAIGNPFGLLSSMTTGIVSATGRTLPSAQMLNPRDASDATNYNNPSIIQVDAQINPGNSGGPLLDINGNVIGITTAIRTETGVFQGVGFAVPVNTARRVVPQLISRGKAEYSWLGIKSVSGQSGLSVAALAEPLKLPVDHGVLVSEVIPNSPAADAGLRGGNRKTTIHAIEVPLGGDIIVAVNGQSIRDMDALIGYLVENTGPNDTVTLTIVRDNETFDVKVQLRPRPTDSNS